MPFCRQVPQEMRGRPFDRSARAAPAKCSPIASTQNPKSRLNRVDQSSVGREESFTKLCGHQFRGVCCEYRSFDT
jgi:hypothetical protein